MTQCLRRIIVAEDDHTTRNLIFTALGLLALPDSPQLVETTDGQEALAALRAGGADVVILDWHMEGMDGLECARRIRAGEHGISPTTPIILLTGADDAGAEEKAREAGVDLFVRKPFSPRQFRRWIAMAIERRRRGGREQGGAVCE